MNNSSLACKGRAQKASKRRKNANFQTKNVCGAVLSIPIKHGSNGPAYEKGGKREEEKIGD